MTRSTSTGPSNAPASAAQDSPDQGAAHENGNNNPEGAELYGQLDDLVRAQKELQQEARQLAARELMERQSNGDEETRADWMLGTARSELLQQLIAEQQEQARQQLTVAARSSEDAAIGFVRSVSNIVRSLVPPALLRPEDLIEATFTLTDQGLRVGRQLALTLSANARDLGPRG